MRENFAKPGNALKRAKEFIEVGKKEQALACLNDVINSKKHRTWTKVHQEIIFMHIQLCVETRNNNQCKEGLHQYKKICQQVNINSLDASIRHYLALAEEKANLARQESRDIVSALECEDLEQDVQTYEGLLLSTVTDDSTQERTDRVTLLPWVKFLWEAYRTVLDMLRNNAKVETLYQETAQRAFKFCVEYGRRNEFRRLCDNLRNHMNQVIKQQGSQYGINLNVEQSMQMHIETRLIQVDCAIKMELWQEAFKAVEDIHGLTSMSRKPPKPQLMANFYQTLALVLWKAGNYLFHACAHHRLYILSREQKKTLTPEENERLATNVLLSTLSIPLTTQRNLTERPYEADDEKSRRLATILGCITVPTRSSLLKDLNKLTVLQFVSNELRNLYRYLELDFQPLCLCGEIAKIFNTLKSANYLEIDRYMSQLEVISIMKQMKQISQVYETVRFSRLVNLIPFADQHRLEKIIVEAARHDLEVKIDHSTKSYIFGSNINFYSSEVDNIVSGPVVQSMPSDVIRSQLLTIYEALQKASVMIAPDRKEKENARLEQLVQKYKRNKTKQHLSILKRKDVIERRKEAIERLHEQRERQQEAEAKKRQEIIMKTEKNRLEEERKRREEEAKNREQKEKDRREALDRVEQLKKTDVGARMLGNLKTEELKNMEADDIYAKQVEQLDKGKKELLVKLKTLEKRIDHLERAKRVEEIPHLKEQYKQQLVEDKIFWEKQEEERIRSCRQEFEHAQSTHKRLSRMLDDRDKFLTIVKEKRSEEYEGNFNKYKQQVKELKEKMMRDRRLQRMQERKSKFIEELKETKQKEREEKSRIEREEEERRIAEERLKKDEEFQRQAQKQREAEERAQKKLEQQQKEVRKYLEKEEQSRVELNSTPVRKTANEHFEKSSESWRTPRAAAADSTNQREERPRAREEKREEEGQWRGGNVNKDRIGWRRSKGSEDTSMKADDERSKQKSESGSYRTPIRDKSDDNRWQRSWGNETKSSKKDESSKSSDYTSWRTSTPSSDSKANPRNFNKSFPKSRSNRDRDRDSDKSNRNDNEQGWKVVDNKRGGDRWR